MNKKSGKQDPLRTSAEAQLARVPNTKLKPGSTEEHLHELQVHQIELEMQNETLRQAQAALEGSRDRYVDLYEFAPVGYLTLTDKGMISEINLTGSTLLKVERNKLLHRRFAPFVATEDRDRWDRHFLNVLTRDDTLTCEVVLQHEEGSRIYARLNCLRLKKDGKESAVRIVLIDITERKQAEDELKLQRDNFTKILNTMTDGIYVVSRSYDIEYINSVIEREFGKVEGRKCYTYFHDRDEPCPWCKNDEVFKGNSVRWEWHLDKTGKSYDLFDTPIVNPDGTVSKFEIFHDITERKQAEQALLQSEADLKTLVEHSPIAMIVDVGVDEDEKIMMMNPKFTALFGYTLEDVPDVRHWWPLAYPDEKYREALMAEWIGKVEKAIQSHGNIEPMEATVTCKDGQIRYVRVSLASIGNRNIVTFEDLTEHKQAEAQLIEQLEELRRWHDLTVGREGRMLELKHEVNELLAQAGQPPRYPSAENNRMDQ